MSMDSYNEPASPDVLQADDDFSPQTVPVEVQNVIRVDEMPTRCVYQSVLLKTGCDAEMIIGADPRRKRIILWAFGLSTGVETVCLAEDQSTAQAFHGCLLYINQPGLLRYEITSKEPVWARPGIITDTGGTWEGFSVSTDDAFVNMIIELWAN